MSIYDLQGLTGETETLTAGCSNASVTCNSGYSNNCCVKSSVSSTWSFGCYHSVAG
ncbi:hypothetical protein ACFWZT_35485 [Streptomyces alboflavus]|uniref:hypothetical protein n=1 Tax=Streptomyces alboflavus TaxID=67267 RepID=UPI00368ED320